MLKTQEENQIALVSEIDNVHTKTKQKVLEEEEYLKVNIFNNSIFTYNT